MNIETPAIVVAIRTHAEHGAVVRLLTPGDGLQAAYVRGARGRRMRPVVVPGNLVEARLRSRTDEQLAHAELELSHSRAPLLSEPLAAAAIEWATALTAAVLPEGHPYPRLYEALDGLLAAIEAAPSALGWAPSLVRFELLLLAELGFGLDIDRFVAGGGDAPGNPPAGPNRGKPIVLPEFLRGGGHGRWGEIEQGLALTGHFLERDLLAGRGQALAAARARLVDRLRRAGGLI